MPTETQERQSPALSPELSALSPSRFSQVSRVLLQVFFLNLAVAVAKIAFGYASGALSILSDGFHSLTDAGSNVVGLVGVRAARRPPDEDHPYGHRKYETVAAAGVTAGLLLVMLEILRNAFNHLTGRSAPPDISTAGFLIMLVTVAINLWVVRYESGEARRLNSEVLLADALQTRGDVWTSFTVIAALIGAHLGVPILDPLAALVVALFIGAAGYQIATCIAMSSGAGFALPSKSTGGATRRERSYAPATRNPTAWRPGVSAPHCCGALIG